MKKVLSILLALMLLMTLGASAEGGRITATGAKVGRAWNAGAALMKK